MMSRVTFVIFSETMIIFNFLLLSFCFSSSALAKLNYFDVDKPTDILKAFHNYRPLGKPAPGQVEMPATDWPLRENKLDDQMAESTGYGVRGVDNGRRRRRRNNNHHQFLGPMRNIFGGSSHKRQRPYKRLPPAKAPHFRVAVHTPSEVRAY